MADNRRAFSALRPVAAGLVLGARKRSSIGLRARQDVVLVRRCAAVGDDLTFFSQRSLLVEIVGAVKLSNVLGDDDAIRVLPGSLADAVLRVHGGGATGSLRAEISMPGLRPRPRRCGKRLAMLVGTFEPAEIGALARSNAGDKKSHRRRLRLRCTDGSDSQKRQHDARPDVHHSSHRKSPCSRFGPYRAQREDACTPSAIAPSYYSTKRRAFRRAPASSSTVPARLDRRARRTPAARRISACWRSRVARFLPAA